MTDYKLRPHRAITDEIYEDMLSRSIEPFKINHEARNMYWCNDDVEFIRNFHKGALESYNSPDSKDVILDFVDPQDEDSTILFLLYKHIPNSLVSEAHYDTVIWFSFPNSQDSLSFIYDLDFIKFYNASCLEAGIDSYQSIVSPGQGADDMLNDIAQIGAECYTSVSRDNVNGWAGHTQILKK